MNTEQQIIDLVNTLTGGLVTLQPSHASQIIDLVQKKHTPYAILYRWGQTGYQKIRTIRFSQETLNERIAESIKQTPAEGFYLFECYTADGAFVGKIYSYNPNFF